MCVIPVDIPADDSVSRNRAGNAGAWWLFVMSDLIRLDRIGSTPWGTMGRLELPGGWFCFTLEPQWRDNNEGGSCIPAGDYELEMRQLPIVARTTKGKHMRGWEVKGVMGRNITFHPGNHEKDTHGCILPGRVLAVVAGRPGVTSSGAAFDDMIRRMATREEWTLRVRWAHPEKG